MWVNQSVTHRVNWTPLGSPETPFITSAAPPASTTAPAPAVASAAPPASTAVPTPSIASTVEVPLSTVVADLSARGTATPAEEVARLRILMKEGKKIDLAQMRMLTDIEKKEFTVPPTFPPIDWDKEETNIVALAVVYAGELKDPTAAYAAYNITIRLTRAKDFAERLYNLNKAAFLRFFAK